MVVMMEISTMMDFGRRLPLEKIRHLLRCLPGNTISVGGCTE
jgi:hypothetical protein